MTRLGFFDLSDDIRWGGSDSTLLVGEGGVRRVVRAAVTPSSSCQCCCGEGYSLHLSITTTYCLTSHKVVVWGGGVLFQLWSFLSKYALSQQLGLTRDQLFVVQEERHAHYKLPCRASFLFYVTSVLVTNGAILVYGLGDTAIHPPKPCDTHRVLLILQVVYDISSVSWRARSWDKYIFGRSVY